MATAFGQRICQWFGGSLVRIDVPSQYPIQMFSQVYIVSDNEAGYCQFDVVSNDNNRYQQRMYSPSTEKFEILPCRIPTAMR